MNCPACKSTSEMAYSVLSHSFICSDTACARELVIDPADAEALLDATADNPAPEPVFA